jgi:hypothetical protein
VIIRTASELLELWKTLWKGAKLLAGRERRPGINFFLGM